MLSTGSAAISTAIRLSHKTRMLVSCSWSVLKKERKSKRTDFFFEAWLVPTDFHVFSAVFKFLSFEISANEAHCRVWVGLPRWDE